MRWFNMVAKDGGKSFDIFIYGMIVENGWKWDDSDVTPNDFRDELDKTQGAERLDIYINSMGGHVFAGFAIYNMLKRHPANKVVHIDGVSASIASVISMAGNKIVMPKTSMMLVHKPLSGMVGWFNADDLLNIAAELDKIEVPIVEAYAAKTGMQAKDIRKIMAKDMLMTAEEAVEAGFADEFDEKKDVDASINAAGDKLVVNGIQFDISQIRNFPKDKFRTDNSGARPHADASQPANAKPPELVPGSPAAVPSPIAARPDYGSYEAQIQLNRNAMNRLSLK